MVATLDLARGDRCTGVMQLLAPGAAASPGLAVSPPLPFVEDHGRAAAASAVRCASHSPRLGCAARPCLSRPAQPHFQRLQAYETTFAIQGWAQRVEMAGASRRRSLETQKARS